MTFNPHINIHTSYTLSSRLLYHLNSNTLLLLSHSTPSHARSHVTPSASFIKPEHQTLCSLYLAPIPDPSPWSRYTCPCLVKVPGPFTSLTPTATATFTSSGPLLPPYSDKNKCVFMSNTLSQFPPAPASTVFISCSAAVSSTLNQLDCLCSPLTPTLWKKHHKVQIGTTRH